MSLHSLMFGWEYPPLHAGGLGVACQGLVRGLLSHDVKLTLVLPVASAEDEGRISMLSCGNDIDVKTVKSNLLPYEGRGDYAARMRMYAEGSMNGDLYGPGLEAAVERYTAQSVSMTKDVRADVIHCHDWMTYEAGVRASAHHGIPMVAHVHATELDRTDFHPDPVIAAVERRGLSLAQKIIAVSAYTKNLLCAHYGLPAEKIEVVHNAHDRAAPSQALEPRKAKNSPLVLFLGRLTVQKNPWQFLEVASRIHRVRPDVRFVMAGEGPMLASLIDRACRLGISHAVLFTGKASQKEAELLFRDADCFVMPSLSEPFGLVALEAIAQGTPVVLSRQAGACEVIDHAFKVDFWDTEKMADCILTILREQPLALQLRAEAPRLLQRLNWKNQAARVLSLYHGLLVPA